jgi:hypothetical protein
MPHLTGLSLITICTGREPLRIRGIDIKSYYMGMTGGMSEEIRFPRKQSS